MTSSGRPFVIGTAGHVDHGKTTLVKALTGVDTDRLEEEQRRGMTIDLGFAAFSLAGHPAAIVDVPGHERFLKNMLAGVAGVDVALLVVAADDGVMPQTREHLAILSILGVRQGVVALSKADAVDPELLELAAEDVRAALVDSSLAEAPIIPVSALTGQGLPALQDALAQAMAHARQRDMAAPARLPIDRVFSKQGFGTVVTGTLVAGTLREGDQLVLMPSDQRVRVRSLQVHGGKAPEASAGTRVAVNLAGIEREAVGRGDWLATPGALLATRRLDVRIEVLPDAPRVTHRMRIRLHLGSGETIGRVALLAGDAIEPGQSGLAQLLLEQPVAGAYGDRFVLRRYAPQHLLGGGSILHPSPERHRRGQAAVLAPLAHLEADDPLTAMAEALRQAGARPVAEASLLAFLPVERRSEGITWLQAQAFDLGDGRYLHGEGAGRLAGALTQALADFLRAQAWRVGLSAEELAKRTKQPLPLVKRVATALVRRGEWRAIGRLYSSQHHQPARPPELQRAIEQMLALLAQQPLADSADFQPCGAGDRLQPLLEDLTDEQVLLRVTGDIFTTPAALAAMHARLREAFAREPQLTASQMREAIATSRKYAIPFLEFLDTSGFTRRSGDVRMMRE
ncbi:MAG: selenocysteine-specific translation elongation factor [Candidatus Sericytochromatia bacterium]|nr:selenocysteine-specific translation elongation factor [Candidatus Sericytochromatia bacterium]